MRKSIISISKRTISIILTIMMIFSMMLVGMVTTNAMTVQQAYIYFDNSIAQWSSVYFVVGHSSYSSVYAMSKISNTNMYYLRNVNWDGATYMSFICTSSAWGSGNWGSSNLSNATYYTTAQTFDINSDNTYIAAPTAKQTKNCASNFTWYSNGYAGGNNKSITLGTKIDGTTTTSVKPATLTITSYALTGNGTAGSSSSTGGSYTAAPGASTTLSYSNLSSDYKFLGWVNSSGTTVSTSSTYTFTANSATNAYYANFTSNSYTVTAKARVQTYNFSTGAYNSVADASSSQGTATANPTTVEPGSSTTLTATAGAGYEFAGWYTSSACSGTPASTSATYKPTPAATTTYYALFKQIPETKTLTVASNSNAVVTVTYAGTTYNEGDTAEIPVGATVTVNVTGIASSQYCSSVKAGSVTATGSGSTFTFTMPDSDVSVVATIADKVPATVTVSSNNNDLGTASASPSTGVYVGDTITLTATAKNGSFSKWTISGATLNSGYSATNATVKVTVTGNVTATATFDEKTYEVKTYSSTNATSESSTISMKPTKESGVFISTATVANDTIFTIKRLSDNYYAKSSADSAGYWITSTDSSADVTGWASSKTNTNYVFRAQAGKAVYVVYDSNKDEIYLTTDPDNKKTFKVYVKDGTNRNSEGTFVADNLAKLGESRATATNATLGTESHTDYYLYTAPEDTVITVTTTLESNYATAGFYVGAFCVNGKYLEAIKKSATEYISAPYTLTSAEAINNKFEITPVYYNSNIDANNDYIIFYVDAAEVEEEWGGTIAVDAYCYVGGDTGNSDHLFGTFPGQPMYLNRNGYYEIKVPKYRYYMSESTYKKDSNSPISGVTMTSYHADLIHYNLLEGSMSTPWGTGKNYQTYDFADFVTIAKIEGVQTIMFENKWYSQSAKDTGVVTTSSNLGKNPSTLTNVNPWQEYTDYYGNPTDLLGNILTDAQLNSSKKLYVLSQGNYNTNNSSYATEGIWATMWYVYKEDGTFITMGTPADFFVPTSAPYKAIVSAGYQFAETKISYDKEKTSSVTGDSGVRSDGRWYYSKLGLEFTSNVEIEYKTEGSTFVADTNTNTENTGFIGEVTNGTKATLNGFTEATFTQVDEITALSCNVANGWQFVGWYIKSTKDGQTTYTEIGTTTSINDFKMSNAYTLVARVEKIPVGSLILTHSQYTGSDPAYHAGTGDYYISAIVKDANGNVISSVLDSKTAIAVPSLRADYTIDITLRTVCHGDNTFYAWYEADNGKYFEIAGDEDPRGQSEVSYTFTLEADKLFDINDELATSSLDFYSDIIKVSAYCEITYRYYARYDGSLVSNKVDYVVRNVELSLEEIANNYTPSYETITKNAPMVDTMYLDTEWKLNSLTVKYPGRSVAEVEATQVDKVCKVIAPDFESLEDDPEDIMYNPAVDVVFNSWFTDSEGNFILNAPSKVGNYSFTRWEVYKLDAQGNPTDELVTVLSDRVFTLRIMADYMLVPVYAETPDRITAHISTPVYNREVFGDSNNPTDRLYVDFLVAFTSTDIPVFKENTTEYTVECGVIIDRNNKLALTADDRTAIVNAATNNAANPLNIDKYVDQFGTNYDEITRVAFDDQYVDKDKVAYTDENGKDHRLTKYVFNNDQLTNKNRIDKVLVYTNNEANQNYIFAAYSYVIIRDISGNVIACAITTEADAQFYNLCYTGNKPYINSEN